MSGWGAALLPVVAPRRTSRQSDAPHGVSSVGLVPSGLQQFYNNELLSDTVLLASDGTRFHCHKLVLAMWSPPLCAMVTGGWHETGANTVQMPDAPAAILELFLKFAYGDVCDPEPTQLLPLARLADRYDVGPLSNACLRGFQLAAQSSTLTCALYLGAKDLTQGSMEVNLEAREEETQARYTAVLRQRQLVDVGGVNWLTWLTLLLSKVRLLVDEEPDEWRCLAYEDMVKMFQYHASHDFEDLWPVGRLLLDHKGVDLRGTSCPRAIDLFDCLTCWVEGDEELRSSCMEALLRLVPLDTMTHLQLNQVRYHPLSHHCPSLQELISSALATRGARLSLNHFHTLHLRYGGLPEQ